MTKINLSLRPTETAVFQAAAAIYAAFVSTGRVPDGEENQWLDRALQQAIKLAQNTDETVVSDGEFN